MCRQTCIIEDDFCLDDEPMTSVGSKGCVEEETCCTKDGWDEEGCLEC